MATDTPHGGAPIQFLEARHRGHARVEDRIRCGKEAGFGRFPSRVVAINQAWLELALACIDLLAGTPNTCWTAISPTERSRRICATGLTHIAARITPHRPTNPGSASPKPGPGHRPAFAHLTALPRPVT